MFSKGQCISHKIPIVSNRLTHLQTHALWVSEKKWLYFVPSVPLSRIGNNTLVHKTVCMQQ